MKSSALHLESLQRSPLSPNSLHGKMVDTPWGPSERLRERRLKPGPGRSREDVEASQRERLFGAMVACVSEQGYAATKLDDLVELSGVSTASFYRLFASKEACFLAATEQMLEAALAVAKVDGPGTWDERVRGALSAAAELVVSQPAAAKMLLIDSYAAGPEVMAAIDRAASELQRRAVALAAEAPGGSDLPDEVPAALVGAVQELARDRLRRGRARTLPKLMEYVAEVALAYRPPTEPLTYGGRLPRPHPETLEVPGAAERAIRALAVVAEEQGYPAVTVDDVVKRAAMSPTTFYAEFADKREVMLAAIDSAGAQMAAATLPAFRRNPDWPAALRIAFMDLLAYLASRPALARLVFVEAYAGGPEALQRREEALEPLTALLAPGRSGGADLPPVTGEVLWAAIIALIGQQIRESEAHSLPALEPTLTFLASCPYLGSEGATAAARGGDRSRRTGRGRLEAIVAHYEDPQAERFDSALAFRPATAEELAAELGLSVQDARRLLGNLLRAGFVESVEGRTKDDPVEGAYAYSKKGVISEEAVQHMSPVEWQRLGTTIMNLLDQEAGEALEAGTFHLRPEHVVVRAPMDLDEAGWREISDILQSALGGMLDAIDRSQDRLATSGERPIRATAGLLLFEMPQRRRGNRG
jgi:AcrR family transcriptional regulator